VHTTLVFASILLVLSGGYTLIRKLRYLRNWPQRRLLQFVVLTLPAIVPGMAIGGLYDVSKRFCLVGITPWDSIVGLILPLVMTLIVLGAILLGIVRLFLMKHVVYRRAVPADPALRNDVHILVRQFGGKTPYVLLCHYDHPLALTSGIFRPTILLSTWMMEHLDQHERETVLAHELKHIVRRDYLILFLATLLRDAFFYIPTSRAVYRQIQQEKELACDDAAAEITGRPLALASALTKVWLHSVDGSWLSKWSIAQTLFTIDASLHGRIKRLITPEGAIASEKDIESIKSNATLSAFLTSFLVQGSNVTILLMLISCTHYVFGR
jgi:Zn-dependent protease with chaperone function